jgi:hypothetical protein
MKRWALRCARSDLIGALLLCNFSIPLAALRMLRRDLQQPAQATRVIPGLPVPGNLLFRLPPVELTVGFRPRAYPKISFTLSKIDELRSAGLFSTWIEAPSCSINLRCSRVSFVGVNTRT